MFTKQNDYRQVMFTKQTTKFIDQLYLQIQNKQNVYKTLYVYKTKQNVYRQVKFTKQNRKYTNTLS